MSTASADTDLSYSTRFGRRLSVRKKHLADPEPTERDNSSSRQLASDPPVQEGASAEPSLDPSQLPPDSAYAPSPSSRLKPINEANGDMPIRRATSPRLGLFPTTEPLTPSAASVRSTSASYQTDSFSPAKSTATKSVATAASNGNINGVVKSNGAPPPQKPVEQPERKSRGMSLRKFFGAKSARPGNRATLTYGDLA